MRSKTLILLTAMTLFAALAIPVGLGAQEREDESAKTSAANPVPLINQPLVADARKPGGTGFTLIVNGTGFVPGSLVHWNGSPLHTSFVGSSKLTASVLASDMAEASTASVTVVNPGGGISNPGFFEITVSTPAISLNRSRSYTVGSGPQSVATADFNGDGKLDLVVANLYSNTVSVLLGNGDGTFKLPVDYETGLNPASVAVGDFNGDGRVDLVVTTAGPTVSILLGNGNGTFKPYVEYATGLNPDAVAVGDFNGDGKLDVVTANDNQNLSGTVSVLLGNGDGTFQTHVDYGTGTGPTSVAVGDFNGDDKLDLVSANYVAGTVSVLLGNGDGTFMPQVDYATGSQPISVAVGDLNRDGKLDLAVANFADGTVSVLLGNGNGTFQAHIDYPAGVGQSVPYWVVMGDFNGDGKVDLAVANDVAQTVSVLLGNGTGTFHTHADYGTGSNPQSLAVGDFNRDGRLDLAVANYSFSGSGTVSVLTQTSTVGANATLLPNSLTFATQLVGTTSPAQSVTLTNYGEKTLSITRMMASSGAFSLTNNCGSSLAARKNCTISVAFKSLQSGTQTGTVSITDNAPGSPQKVALAGTGTAVELNPTSLNFACVRSPPFDNCVCTTSQTTTLTNTGSTTLSITGITTTDGFFQTNTCDSSVGAGKPCTVTVGWSAQHVSSGTVSISDNGGGSPQTVPLIGRDFCSR